MHAFPIYLLFQPYGNNINTVHARVQTQDLSIQSWMILPTQLKCDHMMVYG